MHSDEAIHGVGAAISSVELSRATIWIQPSYGSVVAKEWGAKRRLPPYVVIPDKDSARRRAFLAPLTIIVFR